MNEEYLPSTKKEYGGRPEQTTFPPAEQYIHRNSAYGVPEREQTQEWMRMRQADDF